MNSTHSDLAENWSGAEISPSKERERKKKRLEWPRTSFDRGEKKDNKTLTDLLEA